MRKSRLQMVVNISVVMVGVLFVMFFVYMNTFENISVYKARDTVSYHKVENVVVNKITDLESPADFRKEYRWKLEDISTSESSLSFYVVHHYAEVYFDGELMYRLTSKESNWLGRSVSSNWVIVPLYPEDNGKEVRVVLTPVYKNVANQENVFMIGPFFAVFMDELKRDFIQLFLGVLCIILGLIEIFFFMRHQEKNTELLYLGSFSILIGFWKVTDVRVASLLFPSNPMAMGYFTLSMLFLCNLPELLFIRSRVSSAKAVRNLNITAFCACILAFGVLCCQVFGIAELREMIILCHIMLLVSLITISISVTLGNRQITRSNYTRGSAYFALLLGGGGLIDLMIFYRTKGLSSVFCTMITFVIYSLIVFVMNIRESTQKAYTDAQTSLFNKRRCNELLNSQYSLEEPIGIMILDLNSLKHINDTLGHESGDEMILSFAQILRHTIPQNETICRWGGDEFVIVAENASHEKMYSYETAIKAAVNKYNESSSKVSIHYASGYALSCDFEDLTREELFQKADEKMYFNKKEWYDTRRKA